MRFSWPTLGTPPSPGYIGRCTLGLLLELPPIDNCCKMVEGRGVAPAFYFNRHI